ncbi:MAG: extracellular solute-binding protein [Cyanobacteria bacterium P01_D01_bin.36]
MINRRTLLLGTASLAVGSILSGCNRSSLAPLDVTLLEGAIPPEVLKKFREERAVPVRFHPMMQPQKIFQDLQRWQQQPEKLVRGSRLMFWREKERVPTAHDLVSLSDYWLQSAIANNLIAPLNLPDEQLAPLPTGWQQFVSRDAQGQITPFDVANVWAAPYRVHNLVVVYRESQVKTLTPQAAGQPFQSWRDLLDPALQGRIALPDHPNLVIGLLQKMQTGRFNASFDSSEGSSASPARLVERLNDQLAEPFAALNKQVKTYDANTALKALVNEDLQVVVAWSGDVVTALQRYRDLRAVVPEEGSLLSADMWVRPQGAVAQGESMREVAQQWISFCWGEGPATQLSVAGKGVSPVFLGEDILSDLSTVPDALTGTFEKAWLSPTALQQSEPMLPLPDALQAAYFELWEQLRRA